MSWFPPAPRLIVSVLVMVSAVLAGCDRSDAAEGAENLPEWELVEELVIGSADGAPTEDHALTRVDDLAVGPEGEVYVLQRDEALVRVFDANGRFLRRIGGRGAGPGEFIRPEHLGWHGEDLWVSDPGGGRTTLLDREGRYVDSRQVRQSLGPAVSIAGGQLLANGTLVSRPMVAAILISEGRLDEIPLIHVGADGEALDTLAGLPTANTVITIRTPRGTAIQGPQPINPRAQYAVAPDGSEVVVVTEPQDANEEQRLSIRWFDPDGRQVRTAELPYDPLPLPEAVADSIVHGWAESLAEGGTFPSTAEARRAVAGAMYLPDMQPPITGVTVAADGSLWLRREAFHPGGAVRFTIVAQNGAPVAEATGPATLRLMHSDASHAWGVIEDEMDVNYVVRYRVIGR
jgi:hypothetical protein